MAGITVLVLAAAFAAASGAADHHTLSLIRVSKMKRAMDTQISLAVNATELPAGTPGVSAHGLCSCAPGCIMYNLPIIHVHHSLYVLNYVFVRKLCRPELDVGAVELGRRACSGNRRLGGPAGAS